MIICKEISLSDDMPWDGLAEKSSTATFFQTQDWLTLWLKHFPIKEKILGVFDGEELIGIAPFEQGRTLKGPTLISFLGTTPVVGGELVSDFGDIIAKTSYEKNVWEDEECERFTP